MNNSAKVAVEAARLLILKYKERNQRQLVSPIQITDVRSSGWSEGVGHRSLVEAAKTLLGMVIEVDEFSKEPNIEHVIDAMLIRYESKAEIFVYDSANFCHKRFFVAKELCHAVMGSEDERSLSSTSEEILTLLSDLINDPSLVFDDINRPLVAEVVAYYGAIEMLLPQEFSDKIIGMLEDQCMSTYQVAQEFSVPQKIIEYRYQNPKLRDWFDTVYQSHSYNTVDLRPRVLPCNK